MLVVNKASNEDVSDKKQYLRIITNHDWRILELTKYWLVDLSRPDIILA